MRVRVGAWLFAGQSPVQSKVAESETDGFKADTFTKNDGERPDMVKRRRATMAARSASLAPFPEERRHPLRQGRQGEPLGRSYSQDTGEGQDYWTRRASEARSPRQTRHPTTPCSGKTTVRWLLHEAVVRPDSPLAFWWLGLVAVAVIYNYFAVILRLAFKEMNEKTLFTLLDGVCDAVYLLDVAVQSRMAYLDNGCWVMDTQKIKRHYRKKPKFTLDCLAVVPFAFILSFFTGYRGFIKSQSNFHIGPRIPLLFRLVRLLKYYIVPKFFEISDCRANSPNFIRACKLSLYLWLVIHWIGCFYYIVSEWEGLGSNDWVYPSGDFYDVFIRKYIRCLFWSTMTLTTIGERPSPITDLEFVFTGVTFLIGVFVFAAVVGNVVDVIRNRNASRHDFQRRLDQIKRYLSHRRVPVSLQDRVKRWADYTWARTQAIDDRSVLQLLPDRMRTEVAIHVHLDTLKKVKIFEQCEEGLLRELVLKLRPQIFSPGDFICRAGEIGKEMYILNHGCVEVLVPSGLGGEGTRVAVLTPGNYFGEISLLKLDSGQDRASSCRRTADVRAVGFSELLCLSRRDLMAALTDYPSAKRILEAQGRARMEHTREVKNGLAGDSASDTDSTGSPRPVPRDHLLRVLHREGLQRSGSLAGTSRHSVTEAMEGLRECTADFEKSIEHMKTAFHEMMNGEIASLSKKVWILQRRLARKESQLRCARRSVVNLKQSVASKHRDQDSEEAGAALSAFWAPPVDATSVPLLGLGGEARHHVRASSSAIEPEVHCASTRRLKCGNVATNEAATALEDSQSPVSVRVASRAGESETRQLQGNQAQLPYKIPHNSNSCKILPDRETRSSGLEERKDIESANPTAAMSAQGQQSVQGRSLSHCTRRHLHGNPRTTIRRQGAAVVDNIQESGGDGCSEDSIPASPWKTGEADSGSEKTPAAQGVGQDLCGSVSAAASTGAAAPESDKRAGTVFEVQFDQTRMREAICLVDSAQKL